MNNKNINNILNHIISVKNGMNQKRGVCFLIGAGADITSGGILFRNLKISFLKLFDIFKCIYFKLKYFFNNLLNLLNKLCIIIFFI